MIFKIVDGRSCFYQWDIDRQISVSDPTITEVHFCNKTEDCSLVVEVKDGIANVPNKVLQSGYKVRVFGYDGKATLHEATFEVKARTKPIDYVYTEVEIKNYETALEYIDEKLEDIVNNGVKVDLTDYYTKEEVDTAIEGVASLTVLSCFTRDGVISISNSDLDKEDLRLNPQNYAISYIGWLYSFVRKTSTNLTFSTTFLGIDNKTTHRSLILDLGTLTCTQHTTGNIATETYVDDAIANLDIPEAEVDLTGYATEEYVDNAIANIEVPEVDLSGCIKFYNFSSLASPSEADYAKLKEIIETDDINAYLFTVGGTHKVLRTSNMGGGNILIVYGVWNGPTDNNIYGYQVDYNNNTSTLLVSYKMVSSDEVQTMIDTSLSNIGVAEGGAY